MILQPFQPSKLKFLKFHRQGALPTLAPFHTQYNDLSLSHNYKPQMSAVDNFAIGVAQGQSVHLRKLRSGFDSRCRRKIYSFNDTAWISGFFLSLSLSLSLSVFSVELANSSVISFLFVLFLRLCVQVVHTLSLSLSLSLTITKILFCASSGDFLKLTKLLFVQKHLILLQLMVLESLICNPVVIFV